jgi:hypothetical protein
MRAQTVSSPSRGAPVFESFSHGSEVHTQSARGAASRASMAPAHTSSGGANRGGGSSGGHESGNRNH